jgi:RNA polymerase sigma factor (sigma-70 family)
MSEPTPHHQAFPPTQWSMVLSAQDGDSEERSRGLERICRIYWHPIYAYARKRSFNPQDAEDITQGFFAHLLQTKCFGKIEQRRGKLRTFLLVSVRNFMTNEWEKRSAQKRGGGVPLLSIDLKDAEDHICLEPADDLTPEVVFERHWATTMLQTVMDRLQAAQEKAGKAEQFRVLRDFLSLGRGDRTYREVGNELGISESGVKVAVHRLRKRYRELLLEEISGTLEPGESAEAELRYLFGVFQSC